MTTTIRRVAFDDLTERDIAAWRGLAERALESNPFLEPAYLLPFSRTLADKDVRLHFVTIDEVLVVCALMSPERRPLGPFGYTALSTSSDFGEREMGRTFPLVHRDMPVEAIHAWLSLVQTLGGPSVIWVRDLFADGPLARSLIEAAGARNLPTLTHGHGYVPYIPAGSWSQQSTVTEESQFDAAHLNTHQRKELRRSVRLVQKEFGAAPVWTDRSHDHAAIEEFISLQAAGWKGRGERGGMAFGDSDNRSAALRGAVRAHREAGTLLLGQLSAGGHTLHMSISVGSLAGTWSMLFDTYDETYAKLGVGRLGRVAWLNALVSRAAQGAIDPCARTADKTVLGVFPALRPTAGVLVGNGGMRERAIVRAVRLRERLG